MFVKIRLSECSGAQVPLPDDYRLNGLDACDRRAELTWSEHFLPIYEGQHLHAYCDPWSE